MNEKVDREQLKKQVLAAMELVIAVGETIRELKQVPAGQLYAVTMGVLDLDQFERVIATLVKAGLVRREPSHLLVWVEPHPELN